MRSSWAARRGSIWLPYWPNHDDNPFGHRINQLLKYVPSSTLNDPTWHNTRVLDGDIEAAIRELKAQPGGELQVHGSGVLLQWLLERELVDELDLRIHPVVLGDGLPPLPRARPDARPRGHRLVGDVDRRPRGDLSTVGCRQLSFTRRVSWQRPGGGHTSWI